METTVESKIFAMTNADRDFAILYKDGALDAAVAIHVDTGRHAIAAVDLDGATLAALSLAPPVFDAAQNSATALLVPADSPARERVIPIMPTA